MVHSNSYVNILGPTSFGIVKAMAIIIKVILVVILVFILFALGSALYYLMTDKGESERIVKALTWRIGLSLLLFVTLMFSFAMGWVTPNNI